VNIKTELTEDTINGKTFYYVRINHPSTAAMDRWVVENSGIITCGPFGPAEYGFYSEDTRASFVSRWL